MDAAPQIQLSYGGLWKPWVAVDGQPVEVYKVEEKPDLKKTTCYIEARDGGNFTAHLLDDQTFLTSDWAQCRDSTLRTALGGDSKVPRATRLALLGDCAPRAREEATLSHQAKLGASKVIPPFQTRRATFIDPRDSPYWTFEFRYLSRDLLEIQDIVEASKPPVDTSASPPPVSGSKAAKKGKKRQAVTITLNSDDEGAGEGEDSKEELKRLRARIARLEGVKEEGGSNKKVKKEKGGSSVIVIDD